MSALVLPAHTLHPGIRSLTFVSGAMRNCCAGLVTLFSTCMRLLFVQLSVTYNSICSAYFIRGGVTFLSVSFFLPTASNCGSVFRAAHEYCAPPPRTRGVWKREVLYTLFHIPLAAEVLWCAQPPGNPMPQEILAFPAPQCRAGPVRTLVTLKCHNPSDAELGRVQGPCNGCS